MTKLACLIKRMPDSSMRASHDLYQLSDTDLSPTGYVLVSSIKRPDLQLPAETYIFEASPVGNVLSWTELVDPIAGTILPQAALARAGYRVVPKSEFRVYSGPEQPAEPEAIVVVDPGWVVDPE
jgi:hypothetical protein